MTGRALICKLGKHIEIPGADRIVQVDMFGETIITQKSNEEGTIGLLFDMETALSHEYASKNNMYRHSHLNEDKSVTGYLEDDRRIRAVRLKGVKCSGLFMPLISLTFTGVGPIHIEDQFKIGEEIDIVNGTPICEKYIAKATRSAMNSNKGGKVKQNLVPTFKEHIDTDQWARNSHKVQEGDLVIITEKLHGTSGRCGYLLVDKPLTKWEKFVANYISSPLTAFKIGDFNHAEEYEFVVGSRRVVKSIGGNESENKEHFYDEDLWTKVAKENFEGKLRKGETCYWELVGYTPSGELIMPAVSNKKLEKFMDKKEYKEFIDKYGETTVFNYGCTKDGYDELYTKNYPYKVFVYRITMTNEDGDSIDYSWEQVKRRCEQLGVNHVPELAKFCASEGYVSHLETATEAIVSKLTDAPSDLFPQHVREGVCIRVENGNMIPLFLKNKSFIFKVLEGIVKDNNVVDLEESQA